MSDELEERLRNHARSFDSLLSLIPAKLYYGEDVSDQWSRKKQTPEEKRAAKMAKLDPSNWKSAKDVLDERATAAKRKRELSEDGGVDGDAVELEKPKSIQEQDNPKTKKRKQDGVSKPAPQNLPLTAEQKKERKAERKAAEKDKAQKEKEKLQKRKARKQAEKAQTQHGNEPDSIDVVMEDAPIHEASTHDPKITKDLKDTDQWSTASSSEGAPNILSPSAESGSSSISSIPPSIADQPVVSKSSDSKQTLQPRTSKPPNPSKSSKQILPIQSAADREAAKARLADAISSFRSARKADEPTTIKPRNRAELLEQRRQKEEAKSLAKKEQKRKEREDAARKEDEEIARRFSPGGSGSLLASPRSPPNKDGDSSNANNFSYGRIEFGDGTKLDSTNPDNIIAQHSRKGPRDTQTALLAAKNKATRLAGLDEDKRKTIEEKDMWLAAKKRAHGERVKDDTSLLKKALKRQEGQKKKSEKEWGERKEGIAKAQEIKQKKRSENLAKRKEEKSGKKTGGKKGVKVKKRPGFEGSFRGRTGGAKKKS